MALAVPRERLAGVDLEEKSNVVVVMGRLAAPRRDLMHIDVKDSARDEPRRRTADFFGDLARSDGADIRIAIAVSARLKPEIELPVMHQENLGAIG